MKKPLLLKLFILMVCLMTSLSAVAAEAYACYTSSNTTLTFYYDNYRSSRTGTTFDLNTGDNGPDWYDEVTSYNNSITKVVFNSSFANARPTTTYMWFFEAANLTTITGLNYLNTSEVTNMSAMFQGCRGLTNLNLSSFNTAKVTDMRSMFNECSGLKSLNLSGFETDNVTDMRWMFNSCTGLTSLDLSSFNPKKVTNMQNMFNGCSKLTTIIASNKWNTASVTQSENMFTDCSKLVGGRGTAYNATHTDKAYAHIDGGTSNPGYFTLFIRGDVNADGAVNIADVTTLIDYLLSEAIAPATADCNNDGVENIADVTVLIDFLLTPPTPDYYIVGNDPFGNWNPAAGVKMTRNADGSYSYTATINGSVWFVFASGLSSSWEVFNSNYRFGPSGGQDETVHADTWVNTLLQNNGNGAYKFVGSGEEYVFTFIPSPGIWPIAGKFMIESNVVVCEHNN